MQPSPSSSSSIHRAAAPVGLFRYGSTPGSFLSALTDDFSSPAAATNAASLQYPTAAGVRPSRFFSGGSPSPTSESACKGKGKGKATAHLDGGYATTLKPQGDVGSLEIGLHGHYGPFAGDYSMADLAISSNSTRGGGGGGGSSSLSRPCNSPSGFLFHPMLDDGFFIGRNGRGFTLAGFGLEEGMGNNKMLKSQLSFSQRQDSISHISGVTIPPDAGESSAIAAAYSSDEATGKAFMASNVQIGQWEEPNSIAFLANPGKRGRDKNEDTMAVLHNIDSQYGLPKTSLEIANVENLFQIQQDTVPCRVRAKRGCATHPRSIAERERRSRISEKLRKLQELVPNMDKQTSTADMLDLAIEYIKSLQSLVQRLDQEGANCTCMIENVVS